MISFKHVEQCRLATARSMPVSSVPPTGQVKNSKQAVVTQIARATLQLSDVAPKLASLAADMETNARLQAEQTRATAAFMENLVASVEKTLAPLSESSKQIDELSRSIRVIAEQTKIIAVNASIEAARAGEAGRVFTVIADEIRKLASETASATKNVEVGVGTILSNVEQTIEAIGLDTTQQQQDSGMHWLRAQMASVSKIADKHSRGASDLNGLGKRLNELCETLIVSVGSFRLEAHATAATAVDTLRTHVDITSMNRCRQELKLAEALHKHPFLELAYLTDARGRQTIENIAPEGTPAASNSALGKDWSQRPWFKGAVESETVYISPVYRSVATQGFCFTAAARILRDGETVGVLAVDVNLKELLAV